MASWSRFGADRSCEGLGGGSGRVSGWGRKRGDGGGEEQEGRVGGAAAKPRSW